MSPHVPFRCIAAVRLHDTDITAFPGQIRALAFYSGNKPMEAFTIADGAKALSHVEF